MENDELLEGCLRKQARAQKLLYEKFSGAMMGICLRYLDSREEAQDVLQEGFIKVFKNIGSYSGKGSFEGWIKKIMVNTALDYLRTIKAERFHLNIEDVDYKLSKKAGIIENLNAESLLQLIQTLPLGYRTIFNMYAIEGYSHKEISAQLGISVNTSKSQYSRAKTILQKKLENSNML